MEEDEQYEQKSADPTPNVSTTSQTPLERRSQTDRLGEDARVIAAENETYLRLNEAQRKAKFQDPKLSLIGVKPSRRVIVPPRLQNELIMRAGQRRNPP